MSERAPGEIKHSAEIPVQPEKQHKPEHTPHDKAKHEQHRHDHNIDKIQKSIHKEAISSKETPIGERAAAAQPVLGNQRELKAKAYRHTLVKVRRHLAPAEQTFSKIVHTPIVESMSEVGGKTVARPSGILGGGLLALFGGGFVLYMAKHFGFSYNFSVFVILFGGGFILGLFIESIIKLLKPKT